MMVTSTTTRCLKVTPEVKSQLGACSGLQLVGVGRSEMSSEHLALTCSPS